MEVPAPPHSQAPEEIPPASLCRWRAWLELISDQVGARAELVIHRLPPTNGAAQPRLHERGRTVPEAPERGWNSYHASTPPPVLAPCVFDRCRNPMVRPGNGVGHGTTSCRGYPLSWPDGSSFGALCLHDDEPHPDAVREERRFRELQGWIEEDLRTIAEGALRRRAGSSASHAEQAPTSAPCEVEHIRREAATSRATLEAVLDHLPGMVFVKDADGRYELSNSFHDEQLGVTPGSVPGLVDEDLWPSAEAACFRAMDAAVIAEGRPRRFEEPGTLDGEEHWYLTTKVPFHGVRGPGPGILGMSIDITDLKRARAEREVLADELSASRRLEALGRLAGGIAHDFNNLLTAILGQAELALLLDDLPGPWREAMGEVRRSAERAAQLTSQLLAFGRRQVSQPQALDLNAQLRSLRQLLDRILPEHIDLHLELTDELPAVFVDAGQLEQVVMNLVLNARDAMPTGGRLDITTRGHALDSGDSAGIAVALVVRDRGCGMEPEVLERVFEPFYTTKRKGRGTGLGLATVHGIVHQAGGRIEAASAAGEGSSFTVWLPTTNEPAELPADPRPPHTLDGRGRTVLICEDDPAVRTLTRRLLDRAGFDTLVASDPQEAVSLLSRHPGPLDLLVTDVVLPAGTGRDVAEAVALRHPATPVLFMSGYPADVVADQGVLDRDVRLLEKPFSRTELFDAVAGALEASASA